MLWRILKPACRVAAYTIVFCLIGSKPSITAQEIFEFCGDDSIAVISQDFNSNPGYSLWFVLYDTGLHEIVAANSFGDFSNDVQDGVSYQIHVINFRSDDAPSVISTPAPADLIGLDLAAVNDGCYNDDFESDFLSFIYFNDCPDYCDGENIVQTDEASSVQAGSTICSDAVVPLQTAVSYQAGDFIKLSPGFNASIQTNFSAQIEDCDLVED